MKTSSKRLLGLAALLALALIGFLLLRPTPVPDRTQITQRLEAARAAGERHDVNGIMAVFSEHYHDASVPSPIQLRFLLGKIQGNPPTPIQITQSAPVIDIQGDSATSTSHLRVVSSTSGRVLYDHDITLQWHREDGNRLLVIPAKVWRVVSADYGSFGFGE